MDRDKVIAYLLNPSHPEGSRKAAFFARFGFTPEQWEVFAAALQEHAAEHEVHRSVPSAYGTRYVVDGALRCPDGRLPRIRSVWVVEGDDAPRLITAYPLKREAE